jgi:hypothetical protein
MAGARIVIVNFNAGDNLRRCMAALVAQTKPISMSGSLTTPRRMGRFDMCRPTTGF